MNTEIITNVFTVILFAVAVFTIGVVTGRLVQRRYDKRDLLIRSEVGERLELHLGTAPLPSEGGRLIRRISNHTSND